MAKGGYILKRKEFTHKLKGPGRPWRTTKVDINRILSLVKKNLFIRSSQAQDILKEVDVSLLEFAIKRRLHECKYDDLEQGANTRLVMLDWDFLNKETKNYLPILEYSSSD